LKPRKPEARLSKPGANSRHIEHDLGGGERSARDTIERFGLARDPVF
jgi:hypothetical protein